MEGDFAENFTPALMERQDAIAVKIFHESLFWLMLLVLFGISGILFVMIR